MLEIEVKYRAADHASLEYQLIRMSAHLIDDIQESDSYFNSPSRDFARTDEALRVRESGDNKWVTYKGPRTDAETKTRREIEVRLAASESADTFQDLLVALGFRPVAIVRKRRKIYDVKREGFNIHICLDDVENVGKFVEVEIVAPETELDLAKKAVLELATELGLTAMERRSYLELLLQSQSAKRSIS